MSSNLKQRLIRLGDERPDLRKHLRPILDRVSADESPQVYAEVFVEYSTDRPIPRSLRDKDLYGEIRASLDLHASAPDWVQHFDQTPLIMLAGGAQRGTLAIEDISFEDEGYATLEKGGIEPGEGTVREFAGAVIRDIERLLSKKNVNIEINRNNLEIHM